MQQIANKEAKIQLQNELKKAELLKTYQRNMGIKSMIPPSTGKSTLPKRNNTFRNLYTNTSTRRSPRAQKQAEALSRVLKNKN